MHKSKLLFSMLCCTLQVSLDTSCASRLFTSFKRHIQNEKIISFLNGCGFASLLISTTSDLIDQNHQNNTMNAIFADDLAKTDPELYEVFLTIKKDLHIKEFIALHTRKIDSNNENGTITIGGSYCYDYTKYIFLNPTPSIVLHPDYKTWNKSSLMYVLAHELEHHRQHYKYPGSYHYNPKDPGNALKMECGADAAAADYQHCYYCLHRVKNDHGHNPSAPDTPYHAFTLSKGYFTHDDYDVYAQRAQEDHALCPAHKAGTPKDPITPLKDFLPQKDS